ncbi:MAG: hypothetical protein H6661_07455 [Ardenticatenaceae bacterium]|nr:hypothetical protein [Ardenticatenaceae bacterium]
MTTFNREDSIDLPKLDNLPEPPEPGRVKLCVDSNGVLCAITEDGDLKTVEVTQTQADLLANATSLQTGNTLVKRDVFGSIKVGSRGTGYWPLSFYDNDVMVAAIHRTFGHLEFYGSTATQGRIRQLVELFQALPTADPHIAGQPWNNAGVVTISAG